MSECGIPEYMHGGILRWYEHGIPPGDFLTAVIDNDLSEAIGRADDTNRYLLWNYMNWFSSYAPSGTWGFTTATAKWCGKISRGRGMNGLAKHGADITNTINRELAGGQDITLRRELTPLILPKTMVQEGLKELCESCGYTSIEYRFDEDAFFGVRYVEDQPDTFVDSQLPPMG
jgi:hypothetical protein